MPGSPNGCMPGGSAVDHARRGHWEGAQARLGRVVSGRWTLVALLGVGGTASVYEAVHRNGRRFALKVLHPEFVSIPVVRQRFLSEGYAANKVQHPGAVAILDDGEDSDLIFLVMELFSGRSLAERLTQGGPLSVEEVVRVSASVLDVLAAAHDQGVVHRDIKPSNLFELETGEIKVLDFGVAKVHEAGLANVTQSGLTVGTPAFMAPEQAGGRLDEIDALTDIWAVGATLFQLLTGRLVHDAATTNAAIVAAATQSVVPIRSLRPDLPADLAATIDRALSFERDQRWPNARAMQQALSAGHPTARVSFPRTPSTLAEVSSFPAPAKPRVVFGGRLALAALLAFLVLGALFLAARMRPRVAPLPPPDSDASAHSKPKHADSSAVANAGAAPALTGSAAAAKAAATASTAAAPKKEGQVRSSKKIAPGGPSGTPEAIDFDRRLIDTRQ